MSPWESPDHREFARQQLLLGQVVERGNQLAVGQVAGRAEDHHDAGIAGPAYALRLRSWNCRGVEHEIILVESPSTQKAWTAYAVFLLAAGST